MFTKLGVEGGKKAVNGTVTMPHAITKRSLLFKSACFTCILTLFDLSPVTIDAIVSVTKSTNMGTVRAIATIDESLFLLDVRSK